VFSNDPALKTLGGSAFCLILLLLQDKGKLMKLFSVLSGGLPLAVQ